MKEDKKQEKNKRKLRTLVLLLFLTIIMFGTSTYAWFTANRRVSITSIDVHVETSDGIQISTDGSTWKSVITRDDILVNKYQTADNFIPNTLDAVSTDGTLLENSTAGTRLLDFYLSNIGTNETTGRYTIKTEHVDEATDKTKFVAFDIFLKVSSAKTVYLNTTDSQSSVVVKTGSVSDLGLKNAARMGFVKIGEAASTDTVAQITGAKYASNAPGAKIWEPNNDTHSVAVINSVSTEYGITLTPNGTNSQSQTVYNPLSYCGITSEITTPADLISTVNCSASNATAMSAGTITNSGGEYSTSGTLISTPNELVAGTRYSPFTLNAGITKMRIYMWIEGQDLDCENNASGSDITFNLEFSIPDSTTGS